MKIKQVVLKLTATFEVATSDDYESMAKAAEEVVEAARNYGAVEGTISYPEVTVEIV